MGQFWSGNAAGEVGNSFGKNKTNGWLYRQSCSLSTVLIFWWNPSLNKPGLWFEKSIKSKKTANQKRKLTDLDLYESFELAFQYFFTFAYVLNTLNQYSYKNMLELTCAKFR
jgi:hypothetical protein